MTTQIKAGVIAANAVNSSELASGALSGQNFTGDVTFDTTTLVVDSTNNRVGIGQTSPNSPLEIVKNITFTNSDTFPQLLIRTASGTTGNQLGLGVDETDNVAFIEAIDRGNNVIPLVLQRNAGRVGIGVDNPSTLLQIGDGTTSEYITIDKSTTGESGILFKNAGNNKGKILLDSNENLQFYVNNTTNAMTILESGNVGINTSSPTSYANSQAALVIEDTSSPAIVWSDTGQARDWFAVAQGSGLYFNYADGGGSGGASNVTDVLVLDNSGNVGIGNPSPETRLHISGGDPSIRLQAGSSADARVDFEDSGGTIRWYTGYDVSSGNIVLAADESGFESSVTVQMDNSGNVGIGTTSPSAKLEVNGSLKAEIVYSDTTASGYTSGQTISRTVSSTGEARVYQVFATRHTGTANKSFEMGYVFYSGNGAGSFSQVIDGAGISITVSGSTISATNTTGTATLYLTVLRLR